MLSDRKTNTLALIICCWSSSLTNHVQWYDASVLVKAHLSHVFTDTFSHRSRTCSRRTEWTFEAAVQYKMTKVMWGCKESVSRVKRTRRGMCITVRTCVQPAVELIVRRLASGLDEVLKPRLLTALMAFSTRLEGPRGRGVYHYHSFTPLSRLSSFKKKKNSQNKNLSLH